MALYLMAAATAKLSDLRVDLQSSSGGGVSQNPLPAWCYGNREQLLAPADVLGAERWSPKRMHSDGPGVFTGASVSKGILLSHNAREQQAFG